VCKGYFNDLDKEKREVRDEEWFKEKVVLEMKRD